MTRTALAHRRLELGLSQEKLAYKICAEAQILGETTATLASVTRHVKRIEAGQVANPTDPYKRLIARVLGCTAAELFGEPVVEAPAGDSFSVTSHKFLPAYVGAADIPELADRLHATPATGDHCHQATLEGAEVRLYPFGVAVAHLTEPRHPETIAELARWRVDSYTRNMTILSQQLAGLLHKPVIVEYVLSVYWLHESIWPTGQLESAVRLLSMPRVLLGETTPTRSPGAEECERVLLRGGFTHPGIVDFGVPGTSLGAASWSSVAYHPLVPSRALTPADVVEVEMLVQAVWCYARTICDRIETGQDPDVPERYGERFLRGIRSRCFTARGQESSAHRSMREAIVDTSGLADQLDAAMTALR